MVFTMKAVTWRTVTRSPGSASTVPQGKWKPSRASHGTCQPPKKSVVIIAATSTTSTKSVIMNKVLRARVLREVARDQLGLPFRQVEGDALGLRDARCEEDEEAERLVEHAPRRQPAPEEPALLPRDFLQVEGVVGHHHAHQRETHRDLVG